MRTTRLLWVVAASLVLAGCLDKEPENPAGPSETDTGLSIQRPIGPSFSVTVGNRTDLSPFGADWSYAGDINDAGQAVGSAWWFDENGTYRSRGFLWHDGQMTELPTLGGNYSWARGINNLGHVVGQSALPEGEGRAVLWRDGQVVDLGTLSGNWSWAHDINDRGQIVGSSYTTDGFARAVLWQDGQITDMGTLPGRNRSTALDINEQGQVVGSSYNLEEYEPGRWRSTDHSGFLWQNGQMTELPSLDGGRSWAVRINNQGQIVGGSTISNGQGRAVLWENGQIRTLGTLGGSWSWAYGINEQGHIVGASSTADGGGRAFHWSNGVMTDLGTTGGSYSAAFAINDNRQVAGHSRTASNTRQAALWDIDFHAVQVTVTQGGAPQPGVVVTAVKTSGEGEYQVVRTDSEGGATFTLVDGGWMIHARNLGDVGPDDSGFLLARSPVPDELNATLNTNATEGVNRTGVLYAGPGQTRTYSPENVEQLTASPALVLTGGSSTQQISVEFESGATLTGQLLDENGNPVAVQGENVFLLAGHREGAVLPPLPSGIPGSDLPRGILLSAATFRSDGSFSLSGAPSTKGSESPFLLETNTIIVNDEPVVFVQPVEVTDEEAASGSTVETVLIAEPKRAQVQYLYDPFGDAPGTADVGTISYGWTLTSTGEVSDVFAPSAAVRGDGPYRMHLRYTDPVTGEEQSLRVTARWNATAQEWQITEQMPARLPQGIAVEVRGHAEGSGATLEGKLTWRFTLPGIGRLEFRVIAGEAGAFDFAPDEGFQPAEKPLGDGNTWLTGATE